MKISASIRRPVCPSYRTSLPLCRNPNSAKLVLRSFSFSPEKALPSTARPSILPTLPPIISNTCATVIRDGIACGLMIRSGVIPCSVNGIPSAGTKCPMTPFCPCRLANLSPISGTLWSRTLILAIRDPFSVSDSITESTVPFSPCLTVNEDSLTFWGLRKSVGSAKNRGGLVFPISTSFPFKSISG